MPKGPESSYRFRFFRAGGVDQVVLDQGALENLASLDEKLWLALACPTRGLELEARTLDLIDTDKDGRIRPPELLVATAWAKEAFANLGDLFKPLEDDELPLDAFKTDTDTGRGLRDRARRILTNLGRPDAKAIKLADVLDTEKIFVQTKLNGDGVVPVTATDDPELQKTLTDILAVMGSVKDRSGAPGVDRPKADAFFEQIAQYVAWLGNATDAIRPLGDATEPAWKALSAVKAKVDDYFMRARLATYARELGPRLEASGDEAGALAGRDLAPDDAEVARWPLARVVAGAPLALDVGVNPAWAAKMDAFVTLALGPLLPEAPKTQLTEAHWRDVQGRLTAFGAWVLTKPALGVATLGDARIRELGAGDAQKKVNDLIAEDAALEGENSGIESVEKAIRLRRDLVPLLRNFINFSDFYGKRDGIFQVGTLYVDGRSCDLCLPVHDVAKHAALAGLAKAYLVYCDCTRKGADKRTIVAAITAGDVDNLLVGRNGVFYDRKGDDWDATITKILENPISVRQAFLSPYKRFVRMIEEQVAKRASSAADQQTKAMDEHAAAVATTELTPGATPPTAPAAAAAAPAAAAPGAAPHGPLEGKKFDIGTIAAIGVAVGGFATFASSVFATFLGLGPWMPFGVAALLLAISGPSMIIAWLKLSQRNIGPILDANGWAVNAFARINVPFGGALTQTAELPKGATRLLDDPFAEKKPPYRRYVALGVVVVVAGLWAAGKLDFVLPLEAQPSSVFHHAPAPAPSGAPSAKPAHS
jgi:hypothetical protein